VRPKQSYLKVLTTAMGETVWQLAVKHPIQIANLAVAVSNWILKNIFLEKYLIQKFLGARNKH
jgi:hypothetical protein